MASSSRPIEEGQKRTYWYRCSRLLIEGSLAILKEFLKNHCKGQLDSFLNTNNGILQKLHSKRILSQDQINQLFPHADLESLDITLITCILLNCQPKLQPAQHQYLKDIRDLRNVLFAHISSLSLEENEFSYNWGLIRNCLSNAENVFSVNTCLHELVDKVREEEIGNIERFRDELNAWKCSDDKISSALEEVSRKLDDVAETVEEIKARLPERFKGEGDEVNKEVTDEVWTELQNCLMNDYKTFLIKAPITAIESLSYQADINDIYQEPKLLLVDHTALTKETCDKNQKPITPKDIFPSDRNKCSNIYVTGDAGMGKTSLCKYILSAWCKAHQKGETEKNDFVLAMEQYDFAFYILLRHAVGQDYMKDMIVSQCLQHIVSNNAKLIGFQPKFLLDEVLRLNSDKCLIILDGWDEWRLSANVQSENDGIPLRDSHLNYTILTTTRPWKLEQFRLKESRIDKQVKITGVKGTQNFAEKLILCYNKRDKRNETYNNFEQCLLENNLIELSETPILLKHLVCLWFHNQSIGKSKTEIYTNVIELWLQNEEDRKGVKHLFSSREDIDHNIKIPNVFKKSGKCARYTALLKAVGKLAFVTATQEEVIQLAFDSTDEYEISEDQIKICLDVGILTQSIVPDMTCKRKSISFPHKTFHEFFAALYMGWHCSEHGVITCKMIKGLIEYERMNMYIFLSAIWPSVFESLIEQFYKNKSKDKTEVVYKKNKDDEESQPDMEYVHHLLVNCCCESIAVNKYCPKVEFKFISLSDTYWLYERNKGKDKILFVLSKMLQMEILHPNENGDVVDFSSVSFLQKLNIRERQFASLVVSPCLRYLLLRNVDIVSNEGIVDLISSIATAKNLKRLRICDFNENVKLIVTLDLSNNKNLSILFLKNMCANKLSVSLNITELTLCLFKLASHKEMVSTIKIMSNLTRLKRLTLTCVYCNEHIHRCKKCFLDIDLSETSTLRDICLKDVSISMLGVSPTTENLTIQNVHFKSHEEIVSTVKKMSNLRRLKKVKFSTVYCSEHRSHEICFLGVDLSETSTLSDITLQKVSFSTLRVRPKIKKIKVSDTNLASYEDQAFLMKHATDPRHNISNYTISCSEQNLPQNSSPGTIKIKKVSLRELIVQPKYVSLDTQFASHDAIVPLMKSLTNLTTLGSLDLKNIHCSEHKSHTQCFLDADLSQNTLGTIRFQEMSFSKLNVSPTTTHLTFQDIQLASHEDIVSLMKNLTTLTKLNRLFLRNVHCSEHGSHEICFLGVDLSETSTLSNIWLQKVSFSTLRLSPKIKSIYVSDIHLASYEGQAFLVKYTTDPRHNLSKYTVSCSEQNLPQNSTPGTIMITKVSLGEGSLYLSLHTQFASHDSIVPLMKSLTNLTTPGSLDLKNIHCSEHKSHTQCFLDADLSQNTLGTITFQEMSFSKLIVSLSTTHLTFQDIQLASHEDIVSLMESVTNLTKLNHLFFRNVHCSEHGSHEICFLGVDLSETSTLNYITLQKVSFSTLRLSPKIKSIHVSDIHLALYEGQAFLVKYTTDPRHNLSKYTVSCSEQNLPQNSTPGTIRIEKVSLDEGSLYLSLHTQFASHDSIVPLMKSLTNLTTLGSLDLKNIHCSEHKSHTQCFLDADLSQNTLGTIRFQEMSFSKLIVSPTTTDLTFQDIQLASHEDIVSLMKSVTNMTKLNRLFFRNVHCSEHGSHEICFLGVDLSAMSTLSYLTLQKVSFSTLRLSPKIKNIHVSDIHLALYEDQAFLVKYTTDTRHNLSKYTVFCSEQNLPQNRTPGTIKIEKESLGVGSIYLSLHTQFASHDSIVPLMKSLTNLTTLGSLDLKNIHCIEHKSHSQCFLDVELSQTTLRNITFQEMSFSKLIVSPTTADLTFRDIQLASHKDIGYLMKNMTNLTNLCHLSLRNVYCSEHKSHLQCFFDVDLSQVTRLNITFQEMSFSKLIIKLTPGYLTFHDIQFASHDTIVALMKSLTDLATLGSLDLKNIHCSEHKSHSQCFLDADLSQNTLGTITFQEMSFSKLIVSQATRYLTFHDIQLASHEDIVSLMKSLTNLTKLKRLFLRNVHCSEHGSHEICFLGVDLSETSALVFIGLQKVSFSTLRVSPKTDTINVSDINLASYEDQAFLVKYMTDPRHNMSEYRVSCSEQNLPQNSTPGTIKAQKVSLCVGLLYVSLDTQFASHGAIVALMKSLTDLATLGSLDLKNIHCSEHKSHSQCFVDADFSQNTLETIRFQGMSFSKLIVSPTTTHLTFQDIQLASHEDIGTLMKSVTNLTELFKLSLNHVYCSEHKSHLQCFFDVDLPQNSTLWNIKLQGVSFSKLSVSPATEKLTFHDIQLASHEDIGSLMKNVTNLTELSHLSLRNVYCSEHKSHSQCFPDVDLSHSDIPTKLFIALSESKRVLSQKTTKEVLLREEMEADSSLPLINEPSEFGCDADDAEEQETDSSLSLTNVYGKVQSQSMEFSYCHSDSDDDDVEEEEEDLYRHYLFLNEKDDRDDKNAHRNADDDDDYDDDLFFYDDGDSDDND